MVVRYKIVFVSKQYFYIERLNYYGSSKVKTGIQNAPKTVV